MSVHPENQYANKLFTKEDYDKALDNLLLGSTQLKPDGNNCAICGDSGHQAWECHHNPLVLSNRLEQAECTWRCFFCNEIFTDHEEARKHFGNTSKSTPMCISIKCKCLECDCNPMECSGKE
jgi:hypothetical protein